MIITIKHKDNYKMFQLRNDNKQLRIIKNLQKELPALKFENNNLICKNAVQFDLVVGYYRSMIYDN